jgi:hypothetical protein
MDAARADLDLLLRSRHAMLAIDSEEEEYVSDQLHKAARRLGLPYITWSLTRGLTQHGLPVAGAKTKGVLDGLQAADRHEGPAVFFFKDLTSWIHKPEVRRRLRDLAAHFNRDQRVLAYLSPHADIPAALRTLTVCWRPRLPGREELRQLAWRVLQDFSGKRDVTMGLTPVQFDELLGNLEGLTRSQAEHALRRAVADDLALTPDDLGPIAGARTALLRESGPLEYIPETLDLSAVGGLENLKSWLRTRSKAFGKEAADFGLPPPRGVVLLGVQGCGKSLAARAVAAEWKQPLLRLEAGRLFDKFIGESERNLDRSLAHAEQFAPCVLWIDEIEKAFSFREGSETDGGLSRRLVGQLLGWLQDRTAPVFVAATCNDVRQLPPELIRKGRFDEIFFVDLPTLPEREAILVLHLTNRGRDATAFDIPHLAEAAHGFSGAEIEQAIVSALYAAFAAERELDTALLLAEIRGTQPLSVTRREDLTALRAWAEGRAVPASGTPHG